MQNNENFDHLIKKSFSGDIQFKRVKKEIQLLKELNQDLYKISLQNSALGLKIIIDISQKILKETLEELPENLANSILFEVLLENKYPFVFPKVTCKSSFTKPSLADGRDFLNDIVKKVWSPSILLNEIVVQIPKFLKDVFTNINEKFLLQNYGSYHLGHIYNLEDFMVMDSVCCFVGTELLTNNKTANRHIMITQSSFLNCDIVDNKRGLIKLVSWANLQSLMNVTRRKEEANTLILTWKDVQKKDGILQILNIENSAKFLEELIKNMKSFGVKVNKNIIKQPDLTIDDVTIKAYERTNIEKLLENVELLEKQTEEGLTVKIVNDLMNHYQKTIEYYSAMNDKKFEQFVKKLHLFLERNDVQESLKQNQEIEKKENKEIIEKENQEKIEEQKNKEDENL